MYCYNQYLGKSNASHHNLEVLQLGGEGCLLPL